MRGDDHTTGLILYTQTGCADSDRVRSWLTEQDVAFTERHASTDLEAAQALYATGTFATPLLVVGRTQVLGFRFDLTGRGVAVATLAVAEIVPVLLLGPLAGVVIDRFARKPILIGADLVRAALALSLI